MIIRTNHDILCQHDLTPDPKHIVKVHRLLIYDIVIIVFNISILDTLESGLLWTKSSLCVLTLKTVSTRKTHMQCAVHMWKCQNWSHIFSRSFQQLPPIVQIVGMINQDQQEVLRIYTCTPYISLWMHYTNHTATGGIGGCDYDRLFNTLRPGQNGLHFADDKFKRIFLNENVIISIDISLKFGPKGPINNIPSLVQMMAWRRPGDKPLSGPMMASLLTHICVTRPQRNTKADQYYCVIAVVNAQYPMYYFPHHQRHISP